MAGTYQQFCAVAAALDVVGDRWTLLVVRELLAGPRRYGELMRGLPGVATNLLAERLRRLEAAGLVAQESGADGRVRVYRLTERGAELDGVVGALARFGLGQLPDDAAGLAFRSEWLATAVRFLHRPGVLDAELVVRFEVPGQAPVHVRLGPSGVAVEPARDPADPDVVLVGDPAALVTALREPGRAAELAAQGRLEVQGSVAARERLRAVLGSAG